MRRDAAVARSLSFVGLFVLAQWISVSAAHPLDCSKDSLAAAVEGAREKDAVIPFTGVCAGPIVITTDGLTLLGVGTAVIDGGGQDAIAVAGASRASFTGVEVRNGLNGIVALNGAHLALSGVSVHGNALSGVSLQTGSSGLLDGVVIEQNGLHGLDLRGGSTATITGSLTSTANRVFGINVNGSSITFANAIVTASQNALGIQIATNANAFINDRDTVINAVNNLATGLTVVSGAQLVSFGGTINASGNPAAGVSVNSKAGVDLDAASQLNTSNNGDGLLIQHDSTMTVFNTPQFSGAAGFSTINSHHNARSGVRIVTASTLTLVNQARITSTQNGTFGLVADNGAGITLVNSTLTGNSSRDLQMTFGTRADLQTLTFGTATCDLTVLIRGTSGITCPQ
jgi:hypothetical protein